MGNVVPEPAPAEAVSRSASPRLPQLDLLRGIAILLVLGAHPAIKADDVGWWRSWASAHHRFGWTGVDLFFVLSGFLIGGLLFAEIRQQPLDVRRFLVRRAFKIWPALYWYLLIMLVLSLNVGVPASQMLPFWVHLQNYFPPDHPIAGHTWSLAVEEHFYLALPLLLAVASPFLRASLVVPGFVLLATACTLLRARFGTLPEIRTHLRIDSLAFGVVLAFVYHYHRSIFDRIARRRLPLLVLGLVLVYLATSPDGALTIALTPVALYLGYGAVLVAATGTPDHWYRRVWFRPLLFIGVYSYSIYLWHIDGAYKFLFEFSQTSPAQAIPGWIRYPVGMIGYAALATGVGVLMSRVIEMPALALRDRLFPRVAAPVRSEVVEGTPALPVPAASTPQN